MKTIVVVDSTMPVHYTRVEKSVFRALEHFGIFFEVIDLAWNRITFSELEGAHLIIFAQEGLGKSLGKEETDSVLKSVSQGAGLMALDGYLGWYPREFMKDLQFFAAQEQKVSRLVLNRENSVVKNLYDGEVPLKQPILGYRLSERGNWSTLLSNGEDGSPAVVYRTFGKGRIVFFLISASVWQKNYLGFTEGLDGVFFDSIVWAAKKPYITKSMPPFVTARIDDVSFGGSRTCKHRETVENARWLDILNRQGFIPNIGLFVEDIKAGDSNRLREKYNSGLAEFSPHAFVDFNYGENQDLCPIYIKHTGEEFSKEELRRNFSRVDSLFSQWGIDYSKTINVHFAEIGINSLPFIKERGHKYTMSPLRFGKVWSDPSAHTLELPPYGNSSYTFGYMPEDSHFFNVISRPRRKDVNVPDSDFLFGCTTLHGESAHTDIEKAVKRGAFQIKRGLENGFFGCFSTHEQRISHISPEEWEKITAGISASVQNVPHIMKSYDYISMYAENRTFYSIENASCERSLKVRLKGRSEMPQYLCLFFNEGTSVRESFLKIPEFENLSELNFQI